MMRLRGILYFLLVLSIVTFSGVSLADKTINIPILCYHNFNPTVPGSMNLKPEKLDQQFRWLKDNGFTVIPLSEAVAYLQDKRASLPKKSIVITVDDGWQSAYTYLYPLAKKYNYPITLFVYPATISKGQHAMTWTELKELQNTGLFEIQAHTNSHPNFKLERKVRSSAAFDEYVKNELVDSKKILEEKLGKKITLLAWPFGIYDDKLEQQAANAGYAMAFSIDAIPANRNHKPMSQPRYMIVDGLSMKTFQNIANEATN